MADNNTSVEAMRPNLLGQSGDLSLKFRETFDNIRVSADEFAL